MFEDQTLDLSTADKARKAIADVHRAASELREENGSLRGDVTRMAADLSNANQRIVELQNQVNTAAPAGGSDDELRAFVNDGRLQLRGEVRADNGWTRGLLDRETVPVNEWHADLQRSVEEYNLVAGMMAHGRPQRAARRNLDQVIKRAPASIKRAFSDVAGTGAEWIPDVVMPVLERELVMARRVASLFQTMPMSAKNMKLPFLTTGYRPYLKGTVTGDDPAQYTSSTLVTAERTFDAVGFAVRAQIDEDAAEDAIFDALPVFRSELINALVDGEEDAIINGDSAATHQDTGLSNWDIRSRWGSSGLGGSSDHRRAWVGLRARAADVSNTTDQSGAETTAGFITARGKLASPHGVAGSLICAVSPEYYLLRMLAFTEVLTLDKYGPSATVLSGQLASLVGVPIILSEFVDAQYNASGIYDNTTKTKTGFILLNRDRFKLGERRGAMLETAKDITRGIFNMVATKREIFFTIDSSTKKNVHWSYNLTAS